MGAKPLISEITHYLGQLNERQQKAVLGVVKTFAKEQSCWDNKSYRDAMDKRFVDMESDRVKGITLDELEAGARQSYKVRKAKQSNVEIGTKHKKAHNTAMRSNFQFLLLLCITTVTTRGQEAQPHSLNIGDPAPPVRVRDWIKGTPVQRFEKDKVYVVEFWATWCGPCRAVMPHLTALANEYKDRVTILGIDILEEKTTSMEKIKAFVDSMGHRMDYHVAADDSNFMTTGWLYASR